MNKYMMAAFLLGCQILSSQEMRQPFDFPILLSGNFGELRTNHFHSGIDFKTQGVEGKPVHAVNDGYVSRISVSPWGYGLALYLSHPDGKTTVYGHLQRYNSEISNYVRDQQYAKESFNIDVFLTPEMLPVKKGDVVAYSGNTGSSGGPHLHFEVRDSETETLIDPLDFFKTEIKDTKAPQIKGILVCPMPDKGVVSGKSLDTEVKIITAKNGKQTIPQKIEAWGEIGLAIKADDIMDNTSNIYGVKEITLRLDSQVIYHSNLDSYDFHETRYINSFVDYPMWRNKKGLYTRSFLQPGNKLPFITAHKRGIIDIDQEKTYHLIYEINDAFGNTSTISVWIDGKKQPVPKIDKMGKEHFLWTGENRFGSKGIRLTIPKGALYDDFYFSYKIKEDPTSMADIHNIHNNSVPLHAASTVSLRLNKDTLVAKEKYGLIMIRNGRKQWIGGEYRNGWIDASIKELGAYSISADQEAPRIIPLNQQAWMNKKTFTFTLGDDLSGVQSYRGEIDGAFVLFEMNNRSVISYKIDPDKIQKGTSHKLILKATDAVGNEAQYNYDFYY